MRVGVPKESAENERRVAATRESVKKLVGARLRGLRRVRRRNRRLASPTRPTPKELLASSDLVPAKVTRAQKMDVLSSMAEPRRLPRRRKKVEAAERTYARAEDGVLLRAPGHRGRRAGHGRRPPRKVLIIGAAWPASPPSAPRARWAPRCAPSTPAPQPASRSRAWARKFSRSPSKESGEGGGGYAKVMSPEFIAAEMALFRAQAARSTSSSPPRSCPAPRRPRCCRATWSSASSPAGHRRHGRRAGRQLRAHAPDEVVHNGVKILGFTDLASRMAPGRQPLLRQQPRPPAGRAGHGATAFTLARRRRGPPSLVVHKGEVLPPLPPKSPRPPRWRLRRRSPVQPHRQPRTRSPRSRTS
jgi:hypothetical protein